MLRILVTACLSSARLSFSSLSLTLTAHDGHSSPLNEWILP
jgi:hypothetical protein